MARDLLRKGRAHSSGPEAATPRCALAGVAASEPAIVATATKAANVFLILGPPGVRLRDRRTINDAKKFLPLQVTPSGPLYQVNLAH